MRLKTMAFLCFTAAFLQTGRAGTLQWEQSNPPCVLLKSHFEMGVRDTAAEEIWLVFEIHDIIHETIWTNPISWNGGCWARGSYYAYIDYLPFEAESRRADGTWDHIYATVDGVNTSNPIGRITIENHPHNSVITKPVNGSVAITVRHAATDANGDLRGIRPQKWNATTNELETNGGVFERAGGYSSEVVRTYTITEAGEYYFWMDARDARLQASNTHVSTGAWQNGCHITIRNENPPPPQPPTDLGITASAVNGHVSASGGGNMTVYLGESVTISSTATAPGHLSEHAILGMNADGSIFLLATKGAALAGNSANTSSSLPATWTPPGVGVYTLYAEAFTGTSSGHRQYGISGWPGFAGGVFGGLVDKRITVNVRHNPSGSVQLLDAARNPVALNNGMFSISLGDQFYLKVNGSDQDGDAERYYSRITQPDGTFIDHTDELRDSGDGHNGSRTFGPFTATVEGDWYFWGHVSDATARAWDSVSPWNENANGWSSPPHYKLRVVAPVNNAEFVSQSVPTSIMPGQTASVTVTMQNTGNTTWSDNSPHPYSLGSQNPQDNYTWGFNRVSVGAPPVNPGGTKTFTFTITAPTTPGAYNFQCRMVQDGVEWFGGEAQNVTVNVEAMLPLLEIAASTANGRVSATGGGSMTVYLGESVTVSSTATAPGYLSEHATHGMNADGSTFLLAAKGAALTGNSANTNSGLSATWTPAGVGTYILYAEAFTGTSSGDRQYGISGWPGFAGGPFGGLPAKRITVNVIDLRYYSWGSPSQYYQPDGSGGISYYEIPFHPRPPGSQYQANVEYVGSDYPANGDWINPSLGYYDGSGRFRNIISFSCWTSAGGTGTVYMGITTEMANNEPHALISVSYINCYNAHKRIELGTDAPNADPNLTLTRKEENPGSHYYTFRIPLAAMQCIILAGDYGRVWAYEQWVEKKSQAPVSSRDKAIYLDEGFTPDYTGGSGMGEFQYYVQGHTSWRTSPWRPENAGTYYFHIMKPGDLAYYDAMAGPYTLNVRSLADWGDDGIPVGMLDSNGNGVPDLIERSLGLDPMAPAATNNADPRIQEIRTKGTRDYTYDANGQLITAPERTFTIDAEGNILNQ